MPNYPPGTYNDGGRTASARLEESGRIEKIEGMKSSPLIFPNDLSSSGSFNNHFMIIDILSESESTGKPFGSRGLNRSVATAEQSIVLYMPNTLQFTTQNHYEEQALTSVTSKLLVGAFGDIAGALAEGAQLFGKLMAKPINPVTEVLFSNTTLRQFQFDFLFAPSTEKETNTLRNIVFEMRRAASVDRYFEATSLLWVPPRKLQIRFYSKINGITKENEAFPKLKPLVIENLDFDYAPSGNYSTFRNGYPVSVRMMLRVKEDEVIERAYIEQNDRPGGPREGEGTVDTLPVPQGPLRGLG